MNRRELQQLLADDAMGKFSHPVKTVDEDGFVRDIVSADVDPDTGYLVLRLEIQTKNGEIE